MRYDRPAHSPTPADTAAMPRHTDPYQPVRSRDRSVVARPPDRVAKPSRAPPRPPPSDLAGDGHRQSPRAPLLHSADPSGLSRIPAGRGHSPNIPSTSSSPERNGLPPYLAAG